MQTMYVAVEAISTKSDTQAREAMCAEAVEAYSDVLSEQPDAEWPFEPIDVFTIDHKHFYLADGFHRLAASQSVEPRWNEVPCRVHDGDAIAARMFGITANDTHGLRMSPADKRHCLRWLMKTFPDAPKTSFKKTLGVSERQLRYYVAEIEKGTKRSQSKGSAPKAKVEPVETEFPETNETNRALVHGVNCASQKSPQTKTELEHSDDATVQLVDAAGNEVPAKFTEHQQAAMRILHIARSVDRIRTDAMNASMQAGGQWLDVQSIDTAVRSLKRLISGAAYHTVCPTCQGNPGKKGCKTCSGYGWCPEHMKEQLK